MIGKQKNKEDSSVATDIRTVSRHPENLEKRTLKFEAGIMYASPLGLALAKDIINIDLTDPKKKNGQCMVHMRVDMSDDILLFEWARSLRTGSVLEVEGELEGDRVGKPTIHVANFKILREVKGMGGGT